MRPVFILSTGRTGTDFFTRLFNEVVPEAWSLHEPRPAFRRRGQKLLAGPPSRFDIEYFRIPRMYWNRKRREELYVETNYHLFACIPLIRKAFPEAFIVHIVRDGREVVTSWLNKWRYVNNVHMTPFHFPDHPDQAHWDEWDPLERNAWFWRTVQEVVERDGVDLTLSFERTFKGEQNGVYELLETLGERISYDPEEVQALLGEKVNPRPRGFFPPYPEWPDHWKRNFERIAGRKMQELGYS
ncbi:MAG: sulfotransferase [Flavobacteriales bacterium]